MTNNGANNYGVTFDQIRWNENLLWQHKNTVDVVRTQDIMFDIERERGRSIRLVCLNEYTCGIARVLEVQTEFEDVNLIYVGGVWNNYTGEAKDYCLENMVGLFNTAEMTGALYRDDFWNYYKKDKDGNPV